MAMKVVGYITSDHLKSGFVSHQIQNLSIKLFLERAGHLFLLSWSEYRGRSPLVLNSLLEETFFEGICFYSLEQLDRFPDARASLRKLAETNRWIGFAREGIMFQGINGLADAERLWILKRSLEGPREDLRGFLPREIR